MKEQDCKWVNPQNGVELCGRLTDHESGICGMHRALKDATNAAQVFLAEYNYEDGGYPGDAEACVDDLERQDHVSRYDWDDETGVSFFWFTKDNSFIKVTQTGRSPIIEEVSLIDDLNAAFIN
jgi:hypothetical protein